MEPLAERGGGEGLCGDEGALCCEEMLLCCEGALLLCGERVLLCSEEVLCGEGVLCGDLTGSWEQVPCDEHGGESLFSPVLSSRGGRAALHGRECVLCGEKQCGSEDALGAGVGV